MGLRILYACGTGAALSPDGMWLAHEIRRTSVSGELRVGPACVSVLKKRDRKKPAAQDPGAGD